MIVNTTEECSCSVLANILDKEMWATRMFVDEGTDIVNETRDENERTFGSLLLDYRTNMRSNISRAMINLQLSQLMTGRSSLLLGHASFSCVSLSFLSSIVN